MSAYSRTLSRRPCLPGRGRTYAVVMAQRYELNYGWARIGPTPWTEDSVVTLQVDLHSYHRGDEVWEAMTAWRDALPREGGVTHAGGCEIPEFLRLNDLHTTAWIVSQGEDAFDSIAHWAGRLHAVAEEADDGVEITWTELPHR